MVDDDGWGPRDSLDETSVIYGLGVRTDSHRSGRDCVEGIKMDYKLLPEIKLRCQKDLVPLGFYSEEEFGLWAILHAG